MAKLKLLIGTYNSEPPGSVNDQLERKYQNSYKPFLKVLYEFPKVRASLHYSGILFEWFEEKHPEILIIINEMVKRGQLELIGGGFYDPIFPIIPGKDRINQIELLTTYIRKKFGKRPRGFWLTGRVWEPYICSSIRNSGMSYIFLEEKQFERAGLDGYDLYKPYYTEDLGKVLTVLPIHTNLVKSGYNKNPGDFLDTLVSVRKTDAMVISLMFEGKCITNKKVKWFKELFTLLTSSYSRYFDFIKSGDYVRSLTVLKKIYFPASSGGNIEYWALSPQKQTEWKKMKKKHNSKNIHFCYPSGYFRQFLSKYEKSNLLYSKMLYTHNLVSQLRSDKSRKKSAGEEILKSQSHFAYWHGEHLGFYNHNTRQQAYKYLINAEKNIREKGIFSTHLQAVDFDMDGGDEYIYHGQFINAYVHRMGARLFELDYMITSWNYLNTIRRYYESYHSYEDSKTEVDRNPRDAFVDHFFKENISQGEFENVEYTELGDFASGLFDLKEIDREHKEFTLVKEGNIEKNALRLEKRYNFKKNLIEVTYKITNISEEKFQCLFATEINLSFFSPDKKNLLVQNSKAGVISNHNEYSEVLVSDLKNKVLITMNSGIPFKLWNFPVYSHTMNSLSMDKIYQFNCFLYRWEVSFSPSEVWENTVTIKLEKK